MVYLDAGDVDVSQLFGLNRSDLALDLAAAARRAMEEK